MNKKFEDPIKMAEYGFKLALDKIDALTYDNLATASEIYLIIEEYGIKGDSAFKILEALLKKVNSLSEANKIENIEKRRKEYELLRYCYKDSSLKESMINIDVMTYPFLLELSKQLKASEITWEEFCQKFAQIDRKDVDEWYWNTHQDSYVEMLDGLVETLTPEQRDFSKTKLVIYVPAANETELERLYLAIKDSFTNSEYFINNVKIIIYHNNRKPLDQLEPDIIESVRKVRMHPNILVMEKSDPNSRVQLARKISQDLVFKLLGPSSDLPMLSIDADVMLCSPGLIQDTKNSLDYEQGKLFATCSFEYDPEIRNKFPALGYFFDVEKYIAQKLINSGGDYFCFSTYTMSMSKTMQLFGGYKAYNLGVHLDTAFCYEVRGILNQPTKTVAVHLDGRTLAVSPSKEVENVLDGRIVLDHWHGDGAQTKHQGLKRFDWHTVDNDPANILLASYDDEDSKAILVGMRQYFEEILKRIIAHDFYSMDDRLIQTVNYYVAILIEYANKHGYSLVLKIKDDNQERIAEFKTPSQVTELNPKEYVIGIEDILKTSTDSKV